MYIHPSIQTSKHSFIHSFPGEVLCISQSLEMSNLHVRISSSLQSAIKKKEKLFIFVLELIIRLPRSFSNSVCGSLNINCPFDVASFTNFYYLRLQPCFFPPIYYVFIHFPVLVHHLIFPQPCFYLCLMFLFYLCVQPVWWRTCRLEVFSMTK